MKGRRILPAFLYLSVIITVEIILLGNQLLIIS
jgi:hypothetical protein